MIIYTCECKTLITISTELIWNLNERIVALIILVKNWKKCRQAKLSFADVFVILYVKMLMSALCGYINQNKIKMTFEIQIRHEITLYAWFY